MPWGVDKWLKSAGFGPAIRGFESSHPNQKKTMKHYTIKQVILYRRDLKMRKGKIAAQVAHASMGVLLKKRILLPFLLLVWLPWTMYRWLQSSFAKIVLSVKDEHDLLLAYELAQQAKLPCCLITDSGRTEFNGVPTNTTVAIGPARASDIDRITGKEGLISTKLA